MKQNLQFEFDVDKAKAIVHVRREFAAPLAQVWAAWTQSELLDQWWAPRPYQAKTHRFNFAPGGSWFYSMLGPQGDEHFCRADYTGIQPMQSLGWLDAFTNPQGEINPDFPRSEWHISFTEREATTLVSIEIHHQNGEDLEKISALGFKEGFTMALGNLDELLSQ